MPAVPERNITTKLGQAIKSRWGQWYRHDKVTVDGQELEGFIQVRRRYWGPRGGHRIEIITCFLNSCVMGHNVDWLIRQNAPKETT